MLCDMQEKNLHLRSSVAPTYITRFASFYENRKILERKKSSFVITCCLDKLMSDNEIFGVLKLKPQSMKKYLPCFRGKSRMGCYKIFIGSICGVRDEI